MESHHLLFQFFAIFTAAKIFGEIFSRLKMPAVVGELLAGVFLGAHCLGIISSEDTTLMSLAEMGVIFLLFYVGLEIRVKDFLSAGKTSIMVGLLGAIIPFFFGYIIMAFMGYPQIENLFVGTALMATSVGISARVLKDLGLIKNKVAYIVLGAAVFDDVIALIALAIVKGLGHGSFNLLEIGLLLGEAILFVGFLTFIGPRLAFKYRNIFEKVRIPEGPFVLSIILCLGLSFLAENIGLAAIIGAFMAGIVIDELAGVYDLEVKVKYVNEFLLPFFFVMMGAFVDPYVFLQWNSLILIIIITLIAILSKIIGSALAAWKEGFVVSLQTGVCMVPRGEVGIIVAMIGLSEGTVSMPIYSLVISISILTTLAAPPLIKWAFKEK
ncbi:MAG: cation:proton antiporter [Deltaproteobacteria bacterium]|nr:cation:proton antiporter [Deltaproteobacteria bacterium]